MLKYIEKKKSIYNPDERVSELINYCKQNFSKTDLIDYALKVEKLTTNKSMEEFQLNKFKYKMIVTSM